MGRTKKWLGGVAKWGQILRPRKNDMVHTRSSSDEYTNRHFPKENLIQVVLKKSIPVFLDTKIKNYVLYLDSVIPFFKLTR